MQQLNTVFRGIHKTTDVLSFPQLGTEERKSRSADTTSGLQNFRTSELILGDIVISTQKAASQAKTPDTGFYDEIYRLIIHGVLHLLGYNHEKTRYKAVSMRKKEQELINAIKEMG